MADNVPVAEADSPGPADACRDLGLKRITQTIPADRRARHRDEFNLSLYLYDKAFTFPPSTAWAARWR